VSRSPMSEPARVYEYFCALTKRQPGELNLKTQLEFRAVAGQFFIAPRRKEHFAKLQPIFRAWHAEIEKKNKTEIENQGRQRSYVKRQRRSITNDLWRLLWRLYWNHAAWIILRGEYKTMKKTLSERDIRKQLQERYGYLSQLKRDDWFRDIKGGGVTPLNCAYRDIAEPWGLDGETLRRMLLPGRLKKSPPASLIAVSMDSKKLLSRLLRIPPFRRTAKDWALIHVIEAEAY